MTTAKLRIETQINLSSSRRPSRRTTKKQHTFLGGGVNHRTYVLEPHGVLVIEENMTAVVLSVDAAIYVEYGALPVDNSMTAITHEVRKLFVLDTNVQYLKLSEISGSSVTVQIAYLTASLPVAAANPITFDIGVTSLGPVPINVVTASGTSSGGNAAEALNIEGGVTGDIPVQTSAGVTQFIEPGLPGQVLTETLSKIPIWSTPVVNSELADSNFIISSTTLIVTSLLANQVVDQLPTNQYRSVEYQTQVTSGSAFQTSDVRLIHDGINVFLSEVNMIATGPWIATFDARILNGQMELLITTLNANTRVKIIKSAITI